jgi:hypothetical protein
MRLSDLESELLKQHLLESRRNLRTFFPSPLLFYSFFPQINGSALAHMVIRQRLAAEARVLSQVNPCGICSV